jgi:hypothetical protein
MGDYWVATWMLFSTMESANMLCNHAHFPSATPYLTDLVNDISLGITTYFQKLNEKSALQEVCVTLV